MIDYDFGCSLGPLQESNLESYRQARNDIRVRRWCRQYGLISERDQSLWYHRQNDDQRIAMFEVLKDGLSVGVCGLTDIDLINRRAEFSCYLYPEKMGQGLSKPALKTLFSWGFKSLGLNVIWGETFQGNHALHVFESLGMQVEGTRRDHYFREGKYIDSILLSIKRSEWTY
jgi:RimJ/RimL family protein N-acetyltransferase